MTKYPQTSAPPSSYKGTNAQLHGSMGWSVNGRPATPREIAELKKEIMGANMTMNLALNMANQQMHVMCGNTMTGTIVTPTQDRKQPQDGVIRMVTNKELQDIMIMAILTYQVMGMLIGFAAGAIAYKFGWAPAAMFLVVVPIIGVATYKIIKIHLDNATAKADLLDWPEQK